MHVATSLNPFSKLVAPVMDRINTIRVENLTAIREKGGISITTTFFPDATCSDFLEISFGKRGTQLLDDLSARGIDCSLSLPEISTLKLFDAAQFCNIEREPAKDFLRKILDSHGYVFAQDAHAAAVLAKLHSVLQLQPNLALKLRNPFDFTVIHAKEGFFHSADVDENSHGHIRKALRATNGLFRYQSDILRTNHWAIGQLKTKESDSAS